MFPAPSRRDFLQIVLGGATGLSVAPRAFGQSYPSTPAARAVAQEGHDGPLTATPLGERLTLITGAGGNVLLVTGPDGLALVNGGLPERSGDLLQKVAELSGGKRVQTLFNTDWHAEHTGSNEALGRSRAAIIAHENTKQYLGSELYVDWQSRTYAPRPAHALPTRTFYTTGEMSVGAERIQYGHLGQAHTDGDIFVFFPGSNVLVAGDALSVGAYPICDYTTGGWLGGLVSATKTMIDLSNAETRVVPGVGPLQTRADLQAQYDMLSALRDRLGKMMRQGMGADDMIAAGATKDFDGKWGSPDLFVRTSYRGLWLHVRELGGIV